MPHKVTPDKPNSENLLVSIWTLRRDLLGPCDGIHTFNQQPIFHLPQPSPGILQRLREWSTAPKVSFHLSLADIVANHGKCDSQQRPMDRKQNEAIPSEYAICLPDTDHMLSLGNSALAIAHYESSWVSLDNDENMNRNQNAIDDDGYPPLRMLTRSQAGSGTRSTTLAARHSGHVTARKSAQAHRPPRDAVPR